MATSSEVKAALDEISAMIKSSRQRSKSSKEMITTQETNLNAIPTRFADVITTVDGFGTKDIFEALCKAELAKMIAESQTLVADVSLAVIDLALKTEF